MRAGASETAKLVLGSSMTMVALFAAWYAAVTWGGVSAYVIPPPASVAEALYSGLVVGTLHEHIVFTVTATFLGLLGGCLAAVIVGGAVAEIDFLERSVYPLVVGLQSVPVIAIAPLFIAYFGLDMPSKIVTVALLGFFPVFVNTVAGLQGVNRDLIDMYRTYSGNRWRTFLDVKLPSAAHQVFSGLQVSAALGLIACVVSEFVASTKGLGYIIKSTAGELDVSMMFAAIVILAALGTAAALAVRAAHRLVVFWDLPGEPRSRPAGEK